MFEYFVVQLKWMLEREVLMDNQITKHKKQIIRIFVWDDAILRREETIKLFKIHFDCDFSEFFTYRRV